MEDLAGVTRQRLVRRPLRNHLPSITGCWKDNHLMASRVSAASLLGLAIPCLIGVLLITVALAIGIPKAAFVLGAIKTEGTFAGSELRNTSYGLMSYPTIHFRTRDGRTLTTETTIGSSDEPYGDGDAVPILYDPRHPDHAEIDTVMTLWLTTLIAGIPGLFIAGLSGVLLVAELRGRLVSANTLGPTEGF